MADAGEEKGPIVDKVPSLDEDDEEEEPEEIPFVQRLLFLASCLIMLSGFMGLGANLTAGNVTVAWNIFLVFLFGMVFALLDPPMASESSFIMQFEAVIAKHMFLLSSVTGKGLCVAIAGCTLFNANAAVNSPAVAPKAMNTFAILAGLLSFMIGRSKTRQLSEAREAILNSAPEGYVESQLENVLQPFCHVWPISLGAGAGLAPGEFNEFVNSLGKCDPFEGGDIKLVFKQLSQGKSSIPKGGKNDPKGNVPKLSIADIQAWVDNKTTTILL